MSEMSSKEHTWSGSSTPKNPSPVPETSDSDPDSSDSEKNSDTNELLYKAAYSNPTIHSVMLEDNLRMTKYKQAIDPKIFKNKSVLDIGCGTGILSLWAAEAGAKLVVAVEMSEIAEAAREIVEVNGKSDVIKVFKCEVESQKFHKKLLKLYQEDRSKFSSKGQKEKDKQNESSSPNSSSSEITEPSHEYFDIIISEWMGYTLFYENMLPSVIFARDKYLRKNGMILPDQANLYCCLLKDPNRKARVEFFKNVWDYDMSAALKNIHTRIASGVYYESDALSGRRRIFTVNMYTIKIKDLQTIQMNFSLGLNNKKISSKLQVEVDSLGLYFDVRFYSAHKKVKVKIFLGGQ